MTVLSNSLDTLLYILKVLLLAINILGCIFRLFYLSKLHV